MARTTTEMNLQESHIQGEWHTMDKGVSRTATGKQRLAKRLWATYQADESVTRGGNIAGTVRYRFVVDGQEMPPHEFAVDHLDTF